MIVLLGYVCIATSFYPVRHHNGFFASVQHLSIMDLNFLLILCKKVSNLNTTVCHSILISSKTAEREVCVTSQAICSSKLLQNRELRLVQDTAAMTIPCFLQQTRGAEASTNACWHRCSKHASGVSLT